MKRSEYEAKLNKYEEEIQEIQKCIEELQKIEIEEDGVWKPRLEEKYWYIDNNSFPYKDTWGDTYVDDCRFDIGNVFKTKEEAEFEAERTKVYRKLRQFALNRGRHVGCFCILYDYLNKEIEYIKNETGFTKFGDLVFRTEEDARRAVETVGAEKVLKYYLEV